MAIQHHSTRFLCKYPDWILWGSWWNIQYMKYPRHSTAAQFDLVWCDDYPKVVNLLNYVLYTNLYAKGHKMVILDDALWLEARRINAGFNSIEADLCHLHLPATLLLSKMCKMCTPREAHSASQCFSVAHQGWGRVLLSTICTPTVAHGEQSSSLYMMLEWIKKCELHT